MESRAQPLPARRLRVDLADLADAFDEASWEVSAYLDLDTGEVVRVTTEVHQELEAIEAELLQDSLDEEVRQAAFTAALARRRLPSWMREALREADRVEGGLGTRFIRVPEADAREGYRDMEAFIATVTNPRLQEHLWAAIRGRGAFRRFKDLLAGYPDERERWFAFKDGRVRQRMLAWLASEGIKPFEEPDG
jgi:hypothetical protein